jgi:hypothetical protein
MANRLANRKVGEKHRLREYCDPIPPVMVGVKWVEVGNVPVIG